MSAYTPDIFWTMTRLVYDHRLTAYGDEGESLGVCFGTFLGIILGVKAVG